MSVLCSIPTLAFPKHSPDCSHSDLDKAQMQECQRETSFKALECLFFMFRKMTEHLHVHKIYYGQKLLCSDTFLHTLVLPNSLHLSSFSAPSPCSLPPWTLSLHTLSLLSKCIATHFCCCCHFLKRLNLSASQIALIIVVIYIFVRSYFITVYIPHETVNISGLLTLWNRVVSQGLHSA